jgi:hypothetical protein
VKEASVPAAPSEPGAREVFEEGAFSACTGVASGGMITLARNIPVTKSSTAAVNTNVLFRFLLDRGINSWFFMAWLPPKWRGNPS